MSQGKLLEGRGVAQLATSGSAHTLRLDTLSKMIDWVGDSLVYIGVAPPGTPTNAAGWQIRKITIAIDWDVAVTWADGDALFDNIWDNRGSLTYST